MNPRDTNMAQLTDVKTHRIIRRSTAFGAPYDPNAISEALKWLGELGS
jgi:deferrochelatase/peroxidase EfeB